MKTKIIYISGDELFDMADIRAAFDEVRAALSLDKDTVLFGVPVDNDDALNTAQPVAEVATPIPEVVAEPIVDDTPNQDEPVDADAPRQKSKRQRTKIIPISEPEPEQPVVPILSILGSKNTAEETDDADTLAEHVDGATESDDIITEDVSATESITITDMIADDVPTVEPEKTLEELLESMTPLGEDAEKVAEPISNAPVQDNVSDSTDNTDTDTDITLEKLATEFAETQDKIDTPTKPTTRGKIGKLKNILPFKKAKHDDSGLMGDLFGWAGVAANDEDFTIPGFFTNAASKK